MTIEQLQLGEVGKECTNTLLSMVGNCSPRRFDWTSFTLFFFSFFMSLPLSSLFSLYYTLTPSISSPFSSVVTLIYYTSSFPSMLLACVKSSPSLVIDDLFLSSSVISYSPSSSELFLLLPSPVIHSLLAPNKSYYPSSIITPANLSLLPPSSA